MRSTRVEKKQRRRKTMRSLLLIFTVIIPLGAVCSSFGIYYFANKPERSSAPAAVFSPIEQDSNTFKYSFDLDAKELYRVEIKKLDTYEEAEAQIASLKKKKLNGFIVKEQGFLTAYGIYMNKSQAETAVGFLKRKGIQSTINIVNISQFGIRYDDIDKTLIDLAKATDTVIMKVAAEKAALSLECMYSDKKIQEEGLSVILENEARLEKYLNYLDTVKTSENTVYFKEGLETLIKDLLYDRLESGETYGYYELQMSLMNQMETLRKFYDRLMV